MVSGRLAGALSGAPVVSTHHNLPTNYGFSSRVLERATRPLDTETVAVSNGVLSAFNTSNKDQWSVVHNGINVKQFHSRVFSGEKESSTIPDLARDGPTFLSVGRCVEQKAQQDMIAAMNTVVEQDPDATLLIVGTGSRLERLRQLVEDQELSNNVFLPGFVDSIKPYYRVADCFVSSSLIEGLPITFLEAMAAELPIVATDIPGVNECVVDGWNGFLVPSGSPNELGLQMTEMLDASSREKFSTNAFKFVKEEFSIEQTVEKYHSIYQNCLSSQRSY
jgi:glycosyltransferase involved in cell wall biosynthesis